MLAALLAPVFASSGRLLAIVVWFINKGCRSDSTYSVSNYATFVNEQCLTGKSNFK